MLNISKNSVADKIDRTKYTTLRLLMQSDSHSKKRRRLFSATFGILLACLFLPWTQNIQSRGYVTALDPGKRPQTLQSVISGRIQEWYVSEGQRVSKGDTILFISELRDQFFDPNLVERTESQIRAKKAAVENYREKINALEAQLNALEENRELKLQQARNQLKMARLKVIADSTDLMAAETNERIAKAQYERLETLFDQGLNSRTDLEQRQMKLQEARARRVSQESRLLSSRNAFINAQVQINSTSAEFQNQISKIRSDKFATFSQLNDAEAAVTKLENQLSNISVRQGYYHITAPQDGYITKAMKTGIGENVKEGEGIVTIMPANYRLAVEMYVRPLNLPLVHVGEEIRLQFDGWPSIFFSGWPGVSTGTFAGQVVAIDNFTSKNGKYRVLVAPHPAGEAWPEGVRLGAGARAFALLQDVPIWYELWRQINGFPPDYYRPQDDHIRNWLTKTPTSE